MEKQWQNEVIQYNSSHPEVRVWQTNGKYKVFLRKPQGQTQSESFLPTT